MDKMILFDLDGTLLPMDQEFFTKQYFHALCRHFAPFGYDAQALTAAVWKGTGAMVRNDGSRTNEEAFWDTFAGVLGDKALDDKDEFDRFYAEEFDGLRAFTKPDSVIAGSIRKLRDAGYDLILASNPIFPAIAQKKRMRWAGADPRWFRHITSYENTRYCKPNPDYFREILQTMDLDPSECLMVGNDIREDMRAASAAGIDVFLLERCILHEDEGPRSMWRGYDFPSLLNYLGL